MNKGDEISELALSLCYEIEKLPASEQATTCSAKASELRMKVIDLKDKTDKFFEVLETFARSHS